MQTKFRSTLIAGLIALLTAHGCTQAAFAHGPDRHHDDTHRDRHMPSRDSYDRFQHDRGRSDIVWQRAPIWCEDRRKGRFVCGTRWVPIDPYRTGSY